MGSEWQSYIDTFLSSLSSVLSVRSTNCIVLVDALDRHSQLVSSIVQRQSSTMTLGLSSFRKAKRDEEEEDEDDDDDEEDEDVEDPGIRSTERSKTRSLKCCAICGCPVAI